MHKQPAFGYVEYIVEEHTRKEHFCIIAQKKIIAQEIIIVCVHSCNISAIFITDVHATYHQQCSMHSQVLTEIYAQSLMHILCDVQFVSITMHWSCAQIILYSW